jgi:hypothetical protein
MNMLRTSGSVIGGDGSVDTAGGGGGSTSRDSA